MLDVAIIGAGPAALSAALYLARAGLKTAAFEKLSIGGDLGKIFEISNYPGFTGPASELIRIMQTQATSAGAEIRYGECCAIRLVGSRESSGPDSPGSSKSVFSNAPKTSLATSDSGASNALSPIFEVAIDDEIILSRSVLVCTGSEPRPLSFAITPPVSYCALCDAEFCRGRDIAVVGGGNSAAQEALYLARFAHSVTLITHSHLKAVSALKRQISATPNLSVREHLEPTPELLNKFERVFVFIGRDPITQFLQPLASELQSQGLALLDRRGYVLTGPTARAAIAFSTTQTVSQKNVAQDSTPKTASSVTQKSAPASAQSIATQFVAQDSSTISSHSTILPGLYAAGDVRLGSPQQVITAAGDGVAAALEIIDQLVISSH